MPIRFRSTALARRGARLVGLLAGTALLSLAPDRLAAQGAAPAANAPTSVDEPPAIRREFRAAWVASVANIDWPSKPGMPAWDQQAELIAILNRTVELGMNGVVLQVRPAGDALYASELEPWSEYLTGVQGRAPEPWYDPLAFAVREAHARGLELHAWLNPYRARHSGAKSPLDASHIAKRRPELVHRYGGYLWMDPGEPAVRAHSVAVVADIVKRYDIDGIHIDDYFYPYPETSAGRKLPFPDDHSYARYRRSGGTLGRDDWRRRNVDTFVREMYEAAHRAKPWVKVGISPFGIWRPGFPAGIKGFDQHAELYADARKWLNEGWLDYIAPQLYWHSARTEQSYDRLLGWWVSENTKGRHVWPGNYTSRVMPELQNWPASEVVHQVELTRAQRGATGNIHFSMKVLMPQWVCPVVRSAPCTTATSGTTAVGAAPPPSDTLPPRPAPATRAVSVADALRDGPYAEPALVPASPWLGATPPARPVVTLRDEEDTGVQVLTLRPAPTGKAPAWWAVRTLHDGRWQVRVLPGTQRTMTVASTATGRADRVVVTAVSRTGIESAPATATVAIPVRKGGDQ